MAIKIYNISKEQFEAVDVTRKLIAHDHAHRFAFLDLGNTLGSFALSWRSDLIEPTLYESASAIWVGIDQHLAAIDRKEGYIALSLALNSNLLQLVANDRFIAAVMETEIILFNSTFSIRFLTGLPDIPDHVSIDQRSLDIRLVNGQHISFENGSV